MFSLVKRRCVKKEGGLTKHKFILNSIVIPVVVSLAVAAHHVDPELVLVEAGVIAVRAKK